MAYPTNSKKPKYLRFPVVSQAAEYLVMGYLMRRNILAYKAPPNNEGYDLICIHPDPKRVTKQIRVQVKSRYQTDSDLGFPIKDRTFAAVDYVIAVFLNIGYFYTPGITSREGLEDVDFYTLPVNFVKKHHRKAKSGWDRLLTKDLDLRKYHNERGFEQIARDLDIDYPDRPRFN
jgi:hypothetical protein